MQQTAHKVVVIGHRNPDTDSICSAIAYAELKNKTSDLVCEARRAGKMNQETEFVLKKFGVTPPRMCTDVNPKIRDVDYRQIPGIPGSTSLRKAWEIMRDQKIDTLPVTSEEDELQGVITVKDIATANMDLFDTGILAKSRTSYRNILETLGATMVVGSEDAVCTTGHIRIGTATPEMLESNMEKGDIVILTNRYESQLCAIEKEASLIIICNGAKVGRTIQHIAAETGVAIMSAPCDTYAAAKLISQCAPISYYMTRDDIIKFTLVTPVADVTRVMAKVRHRYFPILDADGKYCGMISRRNIINLRKRRIILVDHNEATQAVEGFDQAEILEIIDHHRIGSLETSGPVYFRNQPVGCTATIVTQMYDENGVTIPQKTAGLLLAACGYVVLIDKAAPFEADRYYVVIYGAVVTAAAVILARLDPRRDAVLALAVVPVLAAHFVHPNEYLYEQYAPRTEALAKTAALPAVVLNNAGYDVAPDLFVTEFAAREAVYQAGAGDDAASLQAAAQSRDLQDGFVVYGYVYDADVLKTMIEDTLDTESVELLTDVAKCPVYYVKLK